jgi:general secretion pathway protein D
MFNIDYILSQRKSTGSTDITLSSSSHKNNNQLYEDSPEYNLGSSTQSGIKIESNDEVEFWKELDLELQGIINRPQDVYIANPPIINKNAGLITVTCTIKQMNRLQNYLKKLQKKVQLQVLIDVQILSIKMVDGKSTGVDWSQLYKLQNMDITTNIKSTNNVPNITDATSTIITATGTAQLSEVIKFLQTQGDVSAISNPKVLTLNNQPALITVGTEYFYKIISTETLAGGNTGQQSTNEDIQAVFAGVLLDITPEIADDKTITLKINPSISQTTEDMSTTEADERTMPPDLERRQLSSVVTVQDGNRIILGGLINTKLEHNGNKVPLLGDIPLLGYMFKYEEEVKAVSELIIIIEPHIIDKAKNKVSLKELGYKGLNSTVLNNDGSMADILIDDKNSTLSKKLKYKDLELSDGIK